MNWLDLVIILILVLNFVLGLKRGLVRSVFGLFAIGLGIFIAVMGSSFLASLILPVVVNRNLAQVLGFAIFFFSIFFLVSALGKIIHDSVKNAFFVPLNVLIGGLFGLLKGIVIVLFLLIPALKNPLLSDAVVNSLEKSTLLTAGEPLIVNVAPAIEFITEKISEQWTTGSSFLKNQDKNTEETEPEKKENTIILPSLNNLKFNTAAEKEKSNEGLSPKSIQINF